MSKHPPASIEASFACCASATESGSHVTMVTTFCTRMTIPEARAALDGLRLGLLPAVPAGWNTVLANALKLELERAQAPALASETT